MSFKRLGEKIREDRKSRGWTLKDLAGKGGISITTLQRIETSAISPSVDLMGKIASKLRKPISSYIVDKKTTCGLIKSKEFKIHKEKGKTLRWAAAKGRFPLDISFFHFLAVRSSATELRSQEGYEGRIVMKGKGIIQREEEVLELSVGDAYLLDLRVPYSEEFFEETEVVGLFLRA